MNKLPENYIGSVTRVFPRKQCVAIKISQGAVEQGSSYQFINDGTYGRHKLIDYTQKISSIQINHQPIEKAEAGQECAVLLNLPPDGLPKRGTEVFLVAAE